MQSPCRATPPLHPFSLRLRGLFILVLAQVSACAINPPVDLAELTAKQSLVQVPGVPFFAQEEFQCGPAALAGVLGAAGVASDPVALARQVYLPARQGSLQVELLGATRRAGRVAYLTRPELSDLLGQVESGIPVLVMQNLRIRSFPAWHYAVLVGFDAGANQVILNSGPEQGLRVDSDKFLRTWDWGGRWAMLALEPGTLPANPEPGLLFEALAAFEPQVDAATAELAWRAAASRFPEMPRFQLALGNLAYAQGQPDVAMSHYRQGLELAPHDPALVNNLASVLGEMGCVHEARAWLEPALATIADDSPWRSILATTRAELQKAPARDTAACAPDASAPLTVRG